MRQKSAKLRWIFGRQENHGKIRRIVVDLGKHKKITELNAVIYRCFLDVFTKSKAAKRSLSVCMSVWIFTK